MSVEEIIIQLKEIQRSNGRVFDQQFFASNEAIENAIGLLSRPTGKWITTESGYVCTACTKESREDTDFCGKCGADMRGGEADD